MGRPSLTEARKTIKEYWSSAEDDHSQIKRDDFCANIVAACNVLEDYGDDDDYDDVQKIKDTAPSIFDYDETGNYIGSIELENGYTA